MKSFLERLGKERLYWDGGTGSLLQAMGLKGGELPETWNLSHPDRIAEVARSYFEAGSDIVNSNTFGANRLHFPDTEELKSIIVSAVAHAREGMRLSGREDGFVALDIGPTGRLLKPMGDLGFEEAVSIFAEVVRFGASAGADLILIETMSDTLEAKAAVLAAKENSSLPVCVTTVYDAGGKLLTGGTPQSVIAMLEGLKVDALGLNCSLGPVQMLPIAKALMEHASVPVICCPNAGLPRSEGGKTVYDLTAETFSEAMTEIASCGVHVLGGCCGTTPDFIRKTIEKTKDLPFTPPVPKHRTTVSSFSKAVEIGSRPVLIGERINPTGKKRFKEALRSGDIDYILQQGIIQEDAGADLLDVNVGLPEIDEAEMMETVVTRLQGICALPLQIDTTDPAALERALRIYSGKAMINSVSGKRESLDTVLPLVARYGGVIVVLPIDESGIPDTADGRIRIAASVIREAQSLGIPKEDIVVDGLAMTISADTTSALTTLETVRRIRSELNVHSILGVSNISFGLPQREIINSAFFTMAMREGLSAAILNPNSQAMMAAYRAFCALSGMDPQCAGFIGAYADKNGYTFGLSPKEAALPSPALTGAVPDGSAQQTAAGAAPGSFSQTTPGSPSGSVQTAPGTPACGSVQTAPGSPSDGSAQQTVTGNGNTGLPSASALSEAIRFGMGTRAEAETRSLLAAGIPSMDIINGGLIPALDLVGKGFEKGTFFLPQLLMSAEAARAAFEIIKETFGEKEQEVKGRVILATVKGDIHDIGKNIVKVLLENYGYEVLDLGKDVPAETIVSKAVDEDIRLIGLSALMTTTVVSMEETIRLLREQKPDTKVVVGGAVMTGQYADSIGADYYAKEAMDTVRYADAVFGHAPAPIKE